MTSFRSLAFVLFVSFAVPLAATCAAEPLLKPNDVVALVGGEDMVAASEYGYLELLLQRALPDHKLKFRCLAWEGDTVFEQPRELNYPTLEAQLDEIGATVVIMQFGQMESLAGTSKLPEFIRAYEKLIERASAGGKRRVVLVGPLLVESEGRPFIQSEATRFDIERAYEDAIEDLAEQKKLRLIDSRFGSVETGSVTRDGIHGNHKAAQFIASGVVRKLTKEPAFVVIPVDDSNEEGVAMREEPLRQLIAAKNRLWFHYYRPQNWAFLNGDRTEQPSSRDHKDPSKRWFPEEMKQFLSLVEAKEKEIWALAAKGAKP